MRKVMLVSMVFVVLMMCLVATSAQAVRPTSTEIGEVIERGLAWMAATQESNGSWSGTYTLGNTASVVLAFEDEGHFPGSGSTYAEVVEKGLDYIFSEAEILTPLPVQDAGNPDSDGDGQGVYFSDDSQTYETGLCLMAIVASNTPNRVVTTGPCTGWTYYEVVVDIVDWFAYGQNEVGNGRGGWRYAPNSVNSDNSAAQWPVLGMIAAEQWGIYAPEWVKTELNFWIDYIQNDTNGCAGYTSPGDTNVSRTGALLVMLYWIGDEADESVRIQNAISCIENRWEDPPSNDDGNKGQTYAMFAVYKGLSLLGVDTLDVVEPDNDWWLDYCEYIVNSQVDVGTDQGYWNGSKSWYSNSLTTAWYVVISQGTIFPVDVDVNLPACACEVDGYDVEIGYSAKRFSVNGVLEVYMDEVLIDTVTLTDFQGESTYTAHVDPGTDGAAVGTHTWSAVMDVNTEEGTPIQSEDTDSINIYLSPEVTDIPDQVIPDYTVPFVAFDLDDYLVVADSSIIWSACVKLCSNLLWS